MSPRHETCTSDLRQSDHEVQTHVYAKVNPRQEIVGIHYIADRAYQAVKCVHSGGTGKKPIPSAYKVFRAGRECRESFRRI